MSKLGRPFALDDTKRQIVCAILAAGGTLEGAARYVGCSCRTVARELNRNPQFQEQLRQAMVQGALAPFQIVRDAAKTQWRAAAWMLEKTHPERYDPHRKRLGTPDRAEQEGAEQADAEQEGAEQEGDGRTLLADSLQRVIERKRREWQLQKSTPPAADGICQQ